MFGHDPDPQRPSRSMLRKVCEFGSVLEHVCQLLVPKVVHLEVIWAVSQGVLLEVSWGSIWGSIWGVLEVGWRSLGRLLGLLQVSLGALKLSVA